MSAPVIYARLAAAHLRGDRGLIVIVALFALLLPLATPRIYATDEVQYYVYLRSLRFDGDLDFANDYQRFAELNPRSGIEGSLLQPNRIRPKTGRYGNIAPVGAAIMWAPFFLLADALCWRMRWCILPMPLACVFRRMGFRRRISLPSVTLRRSTVCWG